MLRPKELTESSAKHGDYDLICDPRGYTTLLATLFRHVRAEGALMIVDRTKPRKTIVRVWRASVDNKVLIEIWTHLEIRFPGFLREGTGYIPAALVASHIVEDEQSIPVLAPLAGSLVYITHLYHKTKDRSDPDVQSRMSYYASALDTAPADATRGSERNDTEAVYLQARTLLRHVIDGRPLHSASREALEQLKRMGIKPERGYFARIERLLWRIRRRVTRNKKPNMVAFVGPDGTGKSTVLRDLTQRLSDNRIFTVRFKSFYRYFLPVSYLMKRAAKKPGVKRNVAEEKYSSLMCTIALPTVLALRILLRRRVWLVDRYFYDYYYKGIRAKNATRFDYTLFATLFSRLVPRLHAMVVLHCPESQRQARKPRELRTDAAERLYDTYIQQIAKNRVRTALFVSTRDDPGVTRQQISKVRDRIAEK